MQDKNTKKEKLTSNRDEQTSTFDKVIEALLDVPVKVLGAVIRRRNLKTSNTKEIKLTVLGSLII